VYANETDTYSFNFICNIADLMFLVSNWI